LRIAAALGIVYVVWGSTYVAIAIALQTLPPFLMASARFLLAGSLLYAWAAPRVPFAIDATDWRHAAIVGVALFLGGNGGVVWAERTVPSGVVALVVATIPLWMALIERIIVGGRLRPQAIAGLVLGFAGLFVLVDPSRPESLDLRGCAVAFGASLAWASGSLYARHARIRTPAVLSSGMQMIAGGAALAILAVARGEPASFEAASVSTASFVAFVYLIVFGSWLAFTAYVWLLRAAPTSTVATYAYVNPVVAVVLGWLFLSEPVTARTVAAGAVIVVAVALIVSTRPVDTSVAQGTAALDPSPDRD
jgi:drug/metabolite transporter (DMT)-like permease